MLLIKELALTFDDVLLVPQYSDIDSRQEVSTEMIFGGRNLKVPIFSANMSTITNGFMANVMGEYGAGAVLDRYADPNNVCKWLDALKELNLPAIPSVGAKQSELIYRYRDHTDEICLDSAIGHSRMMRLAIRHAINAGYKTIIAGNVATESGARVLAEAGATVIKVGVGPGSRCSTRTVTGHGYPQFSAIVEAAKIKREFPSVLIMGDGGLNGTGDCVKAIGAGADCLMSGKLFAGCSEVANPREYNGMASMLEQHRYRGSVNNGLPEGVAMAMEPQNKTTLDVVNEVAAALRSGMSYSGCRTIKEFHEIAQFVRVTSNCALENGIRK